MQWFNHFPRVFITCFTGSQVHSGSKLCFNSVLPNFDFSFVNIKTRKMFSQGTFWKLKHQKNHNTNSAYWDVETHPNLLKGRDKSKINMNRSFIGCFNLIFSCSTLDKFIFATIVCFVALKTVRFISYYSK